MCEGDVCVSMQTIELLMLAFAVLYDKCLTCIVLHLIHDLIRPLSKRAVQKTDVYCSSLLLKLNSKCYKPYAQTKKLFPYNSYAFR